MPSCTAAKIYFFAPIFLLCAIDAIGQGLKVTGKVIDKESKEPIPFVNILAIGSNASTVADIYGNFELVVAKENTRIRISCMGYKPAQIIFGRSESRSVIELERDVIQLETVDVKPLDPFALVREAIQRIPENYGIDNTLISGYYHNSSFLGDKNLRYTEAFLDIYKPPFRFHNNRKNVIGDSIIVREVRTKPSEIDDWKIMLLTPWELGIHLLQGRDVARDFTSTVLSEEWLDSYHFELEDLLNFEGRPTYRIKIHPKKNRKLAIWNGNIFIDEATRAFVKWDVWSTEKVFKRLTSNVGYIMATNLYKFHYKEGEWREAFQYKLAEGVWYLDDVNSGKHFVVNSRKRGMDHIPLVQKLHYKTSEFIKNPILPDSGFLSHDLGRAGKMFEAKYRPEFWTDFDKSRGIVIDEKNYGMKNNFPKFKPYQFSRFDTLKGMLTPLRTAFDVGYYHLDVEVFPEKEEIRGSSLIRFKMLEQTEKIQIDLYSGMTIDSIVHRSKPLDFEREYDAVYVAFEEQLPKDNIEEIKVYFGGKPLDFDPLTPMFASFLWFTDDRGNPWMQAICQGYGASGWWPNKDHLSDEPDSVSISITNPSEFVAVSNGRLVEKLDLGNDKTKTTWHVSYPINNYNITLNIGKYDRITKTFPSLEGELDVEYHVMDYHRENVPGKFESTLRAINTFEKYFGPYPFPRDGIKFVETPHAMEHQSAVALGLGFFRQREYEEVEKAMPNFKAGELPDQILLHEFAHEWWGNSVSCTDNAELWIHEAFATYAEAIFIEAQYGYGHALDYINAMKPSVKNQHPLIGKFGVNHIHYDIWDMYSKGALFLNTLRHVIDNDSLWFSILKGIPKDFKHQSITTGQVLEYFNLHTEKDFKPIFNQYLLLTEIPVLELEKSEGGGTLLRYRWKASTDGFAMPISYSDNVGNNHWLFPNSAWQELDLGSLRIKDLHFHTDRFYIELKKGY